MLSRDEPFLWPTWQTFPFLLGHGVDPMVPSAEVTIFPIRWRLLPLERLKCNSVDLGWVGTGQEGIRLEATLEQIKRGRRVHLRGGGKWYMLVTEKRKKSI